MLDVGCGLKTRGSIKVPQPRLDKGTADMVESVPYKVKGVPFFGPDPAVDSDTSPIFDSALRPFFDADSTTSHCSDLNEAEGEKARGGGGGVRWRVGRSPRPPVKGDISRHESERPITMAGSTTLRLLTVCVFIANGPGPPGRRCGMRARTPNAIRGGRKPIYIRTASARKLNCKCPVFVYRAGRQGQKEKEEEYVCPEGTQGNGNFADPATCRRDLGRVVRIGWEQGRMERLKERAWVRGRERMRNKEEIERKGKKERDSGRETERESKTNKETD
ncbi:hypothetical protein EVAR_38217_1 [Eumeta japonica]|uniref:Uncharacterized protein n=1 Tax=Eumeta variegata TaxID=151549 RepID=A0A4C1XJ39_EUMVA|nr:hypothetical protein EVAR_38217_1 [Eumeta japonica]